VSHIGTVSIESSLDVVNVLMVSCEKNPSWWCDSVNVKIFCGSSICGTWRGWNPQNSFMILSPDIAGYNKVQKFQKSSAV